MLGKTQSDWENEVSIKIINCIINEIYIDLRFMDMALSSFTYKCIDTESVDASIFGTDGENMFLASKRLIEIFKVNSKYLDRAYLHTVMHCIFSHLWIRGKRDQKLWNIACDIAVEYTIDTLDKPCTKRALSLIRVKYYKQFNEIYKGCYAAGIYKFLESADEDIINILRREFYTDDHSHWAKEEKKSAVDNQQGNAKEKWNKISRQTLLKQKQQSEDGESAQQLLENNVNTARHKRNYREFLDKFTLVKEELKCDPDEFDVNFYSYGLQLYKNMPLIEPLESVESKKISELVIVIDTSYSTSGDLVKKFLNETFSILMQRDRFFDKFKVRVIQCDDKVQSDVLIKSKDSISNYEHNFNLVGGGNTDFRPAFDYVNKLVETKEIKDLCGLVYFTDGLGIFPKLPPKYKTAFVFLEDSQEKNVPVWAMKGYFNEY